MHLDASAVDNGPLREVRGSHRAGVLSSNTVLEIARQQQPGECLVPRGGVIAMSPLLIHSSSRARVEAPRRVVPIEYADSLDLGEGIRLALA